MASFSTNFGAQVGSLLALLGPFGLHFLFLVDFGARLALFGSLLLPFRLLFLIFNTF